MPSLPFNLWVISAVLTDLTIIGEAFRDGKRIAWDVILITNAIQALVIGFVTWLVMGG